MSGGYVFQFWWTDQVQHQEQSSLYLSALPSSVGELLALSCTGFTYSLREMVTLCWGFHAGQMCIWGLWKPISPPHRKSVSRIKAAHRGASQDSERETVPWQCHLSFRTPVARSPPLHVPVLVPVDRSLIIPPLEISVYFGTIFFRFPSTGFFQIYPGDESASLCILPLCYQDGKVVCKVSLITSTWYLFSLENKMDSKLDKSVHSLGWAPWHHG